MANPYATGVLSEEHHHRLVADLANFAKDAGIQPRWIWTALADTCGPEAVEYVSWVGMFPRAGKHPRYRHVEVCES